MATKTVISKYTGMDAADGVIEFPQDKTLYVDQFTDMAPVRPGEVFQPQTMSDVFDHYKPVKKNVKMTNEDGATVKEDFRFTAVSDFDDKKMIENSPYLKSRQDAVAAYNNIENRLRQNKHLRAAVTDDDARQSLVKALQALLAELQD